MITAAIYTITPTILYSANVNTTTILRDGTTTSPIAIDTNPIVYVQ